MSGLLIKQGAQTDPPEPFLPAVDESDITPTNAETRLAGWRHMVNEGLSISDSIGFERHSDERMEKIRQINGDLPAYAGEYPTESRVKFLRGLLDRRDVEIDDSGAVVPVTFKGQLAMADANTEKSMRSMLFVDSMVQQFPGEVLSDDQLREALKEDLANRREENLDIMARGSGFHQFLGTGGAAMMDPLILATLPFGVSAGAGRGSLAALASRVAVREAQLGFASEVAIQGEVARFKGAIGSPYTFKEAAFNVLAATLGSAILAPTIATGLELAKRYRAQVKTGAIEATPEADDAAKVLEDIARAEETRIDGIDPREHAERINETRRLVDEWEKVAMDDPEVHGIREAREQVQAVVDDTTPATPESIARRADVQDFDPDDIITDPRRFQFKSEGDAEGVTDALRGVDKFDRRLAGQVLVWEDLDGKTFIVDGHQRLGLARRAKSAGQDDVRLSALVLREADGVDDVLAMRLGAQRNITATTGSPIDAAKIFRGIGEAEADTVLPNLPPRSVLVQQGRALARLGDDAFNMAVNDVIPPNHAAVVGEIIEGDANQVAAITAMNRMKPANITQARAMVEQMRAAGFTTRKQADLFGEQEMAETLVKERAEVVDAALKKAKRDKSTFSKLLERQDEIESAGSNRVSRRASAAVRDEATKTIELVTKLANVAGDVSDAVTDAARRVREGANPADVASDVMKAVRSAADSGDLGRPASGVTISKNPDDLADFISTNPKDISEIAQGAPTRQAELIGTVQRIADDIGGNVVNPGAKKVSGLQDKMSRKRYTSAAELTDAFRAGFLAETDELADQFVENLARSYEVLDEGMSRKALGYVDRKVLVRTNSGHIGEVQVTTQAMWDAKKGKGSALYKEFRAMSPEQQAGPRGEAIRAESFGLYARAAASSSGNAVESAGAPGKIAENVASSRVTPDSRTSAGGTSVQPDSPLSTAAALSDSPTVSTTAGRPSQLSSSISNTSDEIIPRSARLKEAAKAIGDDSLNDLDELVARAKARLEGLEDLEIDIGTVDAPEPRSARDLFDELDATDDALASVEACVRGSRVS